LENLLEILDSIDRSLFIFLNGIHHPVLDFFMFWASDRFIWIPFYALLVFFIVKKFRFESIYILISVAVLVIISDQITSGILKPLFERFRPCHDADLMDYIHLVGRCGGRYGFASSHAANTFGAATFLWLLFRSAYAYAWLLFIWAGFVSYSRIYLGVHYPGDIIIGGLIGILAGILIYYVLLWIQKKRNNEDKLIFNTSVGNNRIKKHP
jgi:undecaprenyl-diphosphatase